MNTKKASWINKPEIRKTTLHSFSFISSGMHSVFFVLPEEGEMEISCTTSVKHAFVLLHTPDEYVLMLPSSITTSFGGVRERFPAETGNRVRLVKKGSCLHFQSGGKTLLTIEKEAFRASAAFGISTHGDGEVDLEVF